MRTANINASNRKQDDFETTLTANKGALKTTLFANETTLTANKSVNLFFETTLIANSAAHKD